MSFEPLPDGWTVWSDEREGRAILAYRPDVFDTEAFPAPCMPTLFVSNRSRKQRPTARYRTTDTWHVTLYLEPEVEGDSETYDDRESAVDGAREYARRFVAGEVAYRDLYQVPREAYLAKLDELVGGGADGSGGDRDGSGSVGGGRDAGADREVENGGTDGDDGERA